MYFYHKIKSREAIYMKHSSRWYMAKVNKNQNAKHLSHFTIWCDQNCSVTLIYHASCSICLLWVVSPLRIAKRNHSYPFKATSTPGWWRCKYGQDVIWYISQQRANRSTNISKRFCFSPPFSHVNRHLVFLILLQRF